MVQSPSKKRKIEEKGEADSEWKTAPPYAPEDPENPRDALYRGSCHCKSVTFELYAQPKGAQYCQSVLSI